uniref:Protein IX n=1 Tax=Bat mastadenovirus TaxID=740971 RepID=A0A8G0RBX2_9ADEN|nr:protein IX [Bat mastadenovirus]
MCCRTPVCTRWTAWITAVMRRIRWVWGLRGRVWGCGHVGVYKGLTGGLVLQ